MVEKDRLREIAHALCSLAPDRVVLNETTDYISLDVGTGNNKNAIGIHPGYVTFIVTDPILVERASAHFDLRPKLEERPTDLSKYCMLGLTTSAICANEELFRSLVDSSIREAESRRELRNTDPRSAAK